MKYLAALCFVFGLSFLGCNSDDVDDSSPCPLESEKLGEIQLDGAVQEFMPYTGGEVLTFSNVEGRPVSLTTSELLQSTYRYIHETPCYNDLPLLGRVPFERYYELAQFFISFESNEYSFLLNYASWDFYVRPAGDTVFYDIVELDAFFKQADTIVESSHVASYRNNEAFILENQLEDLNNNRFVEDTVLAGTAFSNLFHTKSENFDVFVAAFEGIVAFVDEGELFVVQK